MERHVSEAETAIEQGDIEKLKPLNDMGLQSDFGKCPQPEVNSFECPSAIIVACKAKQAKCLEYLLSSESCIIKQASPTDQDETHHNAFYYAIRSGDADLVQMLIAKWPGNYFANHPQELDAILSAAYEELKLNGIPLSNGIKFFLEKQLIDLRYSADTSRRYNDVNDYVKTVKDRVALVMQNVKAISDEYLKAKEIGEQSLYRMKFVAQNINVLKQELKSTYDRLPWEEIEFCLIRFIFAHTTRHRNNFYCNACLEDDKIIRHLENLINRLKSEVNDLHVSSVAKLTTPVRQKRSTVVGDIIRRCPEFEELYQAYQQIRDTHSLERISETLKLGLDADVTKAEGKILIMRMLQILGEYMKNTLESPKLSDSCNDLLHAALPKNARKLILTLRDSISHGDSLLRRAKIETNAEEKFFEGVLKDLIGIGRLVNDLLLARKSSILSSLIQKIRNVDTFDEYREVMKIFRDNFNFECFDDLFSHRIHELIEELDAAVPEQTDYEKFLFHAVHRECLTIQRLFANFNCHRYVLMGFLKAHASEMHARDMLQLKRLNRNFRAVQISEDFDLQKIALLVMRICKSVEVRTKPCDKFYEKFYHVLAMTADPNVKCIDSLKYKLCEEEPSQPITLPCEEYKKELRKKMDVLERILNKYRRGDNQHSFESYDAYKEDKKAKLVIEMLILDLMSILSKLRLGHNGRDFHFVEDICPLLTGTCLRNHLAHNNELVALLVDDPDRVIFLNALKLISPPNGCEKAGLRCPTDLDRCLRTLTTKRLLFAACEEGNRSDLSVCIQRGADVRATCREGRGILHFATNSGSIELLQFLLDLDQNLTLTANELAVAISNGYVGIVEYIVKKIGVPGGPGESSFLHTAAKCGHKSVVEFLIASKSDPKMCDSRGMPIHCAVIHNHRAVVECLLESGKNTINDRATGGYTLLHLAADYNHIELVEYLLGLNSDVNARASMDSSTPLHLAAANGNLRIAQMLVLKGADVNARMSNGLSSLYLATDYNHVNIVSFLLEHDSDVNAADMRGKSTSLHIASERGYKDIVEVLLKSGANVNASNGEGFTPMHLAVAQGHKEIFSILLANDADIHAKSNNNWTLLHFVAKSGQTDIAEALINCLDLNAKSLDETTPLHVAASHGHADVVDIFIDKGISTDLPDAAGNTSLHIAALKGHKQIVEKLLQSGSRLHVKNILGFSPLDLAIMANHEDVIDLIWMRRNDPLSATQLNLAVMVGNLNVVRLMTSKRNVDSKRLCSDAVHFAVFCGHTDIFKFLISHRNGLSIRENAFKLLKEAVLRNNKPIVELLIKHGALENDQSLNEVLFKAVEDHCADVVDVLLRDCKSIDKFSDNGEPLLHRAVRAEFVKILKILIKKCENVDIVSHQGTTALHVAAHLGRREMLEILLDKGANVNFECADGTALHLATANEDNRETVEFLLRRGANVAAMDNRNRTAMHLAVIYNRLEIAKTLLPFCGRNFINHTGNADGLTLPLHYAARFGYTNMMRYLVEQGADIHVRDANGFKAIHRAASGGHTEAIQFLLNQGSSLNETGRDGLTLLHCATVRGQIQVVQYLIAQNVDLNAQTTAGLTPLHFCAMSGCKEIAEVLLKNGAIYNMADNNNRKPVDIDEETQQTENPVKAMLTTIDDFLNAIKCNDISRVQSCIRNGAVLNVIDASGCTPLHFASRRGYAQIVEVLLQNKANVSACTSDGSTPLSYAAEYSHLDIVKLLLSHGARYNSENHSKATPLEVATENSIKEILKLTGDLFRGVAKGSIQVIDELQQIRDPLTFRALVNARNEHNLTLVVAARQSDYPNFDDLLKVHFGEVSFSMDIAQLFTVVEKHFSALKVYRHVLQQMKVHLGPSHFVLLSIQEGIACALYKLSKYDEALITLTEVHDLKRQFLGLDHLDTMDIRSKIALIQHRQGNDKDALAIYTDIYPKQKKLLQPTSQQLLSTQLHMALVLQALQMYDDALKLNTQHYEVSRKANGEDHPQTLYSRNNIALTLSAMGEHERAIQLFEEIHTRRKHALGSFHSNTLRTLHNIAEVIMAQQRYEDARTRFEELFDRQSQRFGLQHHDTLNTQCSLGHVYFKQGNAKAARKAFTDYLRNAEPVLGTTHPSALAAQFIIQQIYAFMPLDQYS